MLTIRLARTGKKNRAQFKIVLQEHTVAPGGRHVEILGSYDPHLKKETLKAERIKYRISQGAQMSDTAYNLFVSRGIIAGEKRKVKLPKKAEPASAEASAADKSLADKMADKETPAVEASKTERATEAPKAGEIKEEIKEEIKAEEKTEKSKPVGEAKA